jgi:hypothetical protein
MTLADDLVINYYVAIARTSPDPVAIAEQGIGFLFTILAVGNH